MATKYSLLATACIQPEPFPMLERTDPNLRLRDYVHALTWWLELENDAIGDLVVLENSGYDANLFRNLLWGECRRARRDLQVLSYQAGPIPEGVHYGYSEFRMMDDLMDRSDLLGAHFMKITGRYTYPRISTLLSATDKSCLFSIDSRRRPRIPFLFKNPSVSCISGLFFCNRSFFDNEIRKLYQQMRAEPRHTHIEDLIFDKLIHRHGTRGRGGISLRFPIECPAHGIGGNGQGMFTKCKRLESMIRSLQRRTIPSLWI